MALKRSRATYFSVEGGDVESTSSVIARALAPFSAWIAGKGTSLYSSTSMHGSPDLPLMKLNKDLLLSLVDVDPRGALFSQPSMSRALTCILDASGYSSTFQLSSGANGQDGQLPEEQRVALAGHP